MIKLLSADEYAKKIGVTPCRVRVLFREKRIPGAFRIGNTMVFPENSLPTPASRGPKMKILTTSS